MEATTASKLDQWRQQPECLEVALPLWTQLFHEATETSSELYQLLQEGEVEALYEHAAKPLLHLPSGETFLTWFCEKVAHEAPVSHAAKELAILLGKHLEPLAMPTEDLESVVLQIGGGTLIWDEFAQKAVFNYLERGDFQDFATLLDVSLPGSWPALDPGNVEDVRPKFFLNGERKLFLSLLGLDAWHRAVKEHNVAKLRQLAQDPRMQLLVNVVDEDGLSVMMRLAKEQKPNLPALKEVLLAGGNPNQIHGELTPYVILALKKSLAASLIEQHFGVQSLVSPMQLFFQHFVVGSVSGLNALLDQGLEVNQELVEAALAQTATAQSQKVVDALGFILGQCSKRPVLTRAYLQLQRWNEEFLDSVTGEPLSFKDICNAIAQKIFYIIVAESRFDLATATAPETLPSPTAVDARDSNDNTSLMRFILTGPNEAADIFPLLDAGSNINLDHNGTTPLITIGLAHPEWVDTIMEHEKVNVEEVLASLLQYLKKTDSQAVVNLLPTVIKRCDDQILLMRVHSQLDKLAAGLKVQAVRNAIHSRTVANELRVGGESIGKEISVEGADGTQFDGVNALGQTEFSQLTIAGKQMEQLKESFHSASRDLPDSRGTTPLLYSVLLGRLDVAHFLVEQGASSVLPDPHGVSPLMVVNRMAERSKDRAWVQLAMRMAQGGPGWYDTEAHHAADHGAIASGVRIDYGHALRACRNDNLAEFLAWLEKGGDHKVVVGGVPLLYQAAAAGSTRIVFFLLNLGVDGGAIGPDGKTAWDLAYHSANQEITMALTAAGFRQKKGVLDETVKLYRLFEKNGNLNDMLFYAQKDPRLFTLADKETGNNLVHAAAQSGDINLLSKAVAARAPLNCVNHAFKFPGDLADGRAKEIIRIAWHCDRYGIERPLHVEVAEELPDSPRGLSAYLPLRSPRSGSTRLPRTSPLTGAPSAAPGSLKSPGSGGSQRRHSSRVNQSPPPSPRNGSPPASPHKVGSGSTSPVPALRLGSVGNDSKQRRRSDSTKIPKAGWTAGWGSKSAKNLLSSKDKE